MPLIHFQKSNYTAPKKHTVGSQYHPPGHRPSTTPIPMIPPDLRFTESIYYFIILGLLSLGGFTFVMLRYLPSMRFEYEENHIETAEDDGHAQVYVFVFSQILECFTLPGLFWHSKPRSCTVFLETLQYLTTYLWELIGKLIKNYNVT